MVLLPVNIHVQKYHKTLWEISCASHAEIRFESKHD